MADILDYVFGNCLQLSSTQFLYSNRFIIIGNSETRIVFMLLFLCICSQFITWRGIQKKLVALCISEEVWPKFSRAVSKKCDTGSRRSTWMSGKVFAVSYDKWTKLNVPNFVQVASGNNLLKFNKTDKHHVIKTDKAGSPVSDRNLHKNKVKTAISMHGQRSWYPNTKN